MIVKNAAVRRWIVILFIIYLFYLIWAVLFKFSFSYTEIPYKRRYININLFFNPAGSFYTPVFIREKVMNLLIFIPFGAYLYMLGSRRFLPSLAIILLASLLLETIQYAFALGTSDIADVATNTCGGMIGYLLIRLSIKISRKKEGMLLHFVVLAGIMTLVVIAGTLLLKFGH